MSNALQVYARTTLQQWRLGQLHVLCGVMITPSVLAQTVFTGLTSFNLLDLHLSEAFRNNKDVLISGNSTYYDISSLLSFILKVNEANATQCPPLSMFYTSHWHPQSQLPDIWKYSNKRNLLVWLAVTWKWSNINSQTVTQSHSKYRMEKKKKKKKNKKKPPNKNLRNPRKKNYWQKLNHYNLPFKRQ